LLCDSDCAWAPNIDPGEPVEDGLYIGVTAGIILFRAQGGDLLVQAGEYAFIPMASRVPERLDAPPSVLIDDNDLRTDAADDASSAATGFDNKLGPRRRPGTHAPETQSADPKGNTGPESPRQPVIGIDPDGAPTDITPGNSPTPGNGRTISYATGPLGAFGTAFSAAQLNDPASLKLDAGNNLEGFVGLYPGGTAGEPAAWSLGTSTSTDTGFDTLTVLRWGRWSGGVATGILLRDGSSIDTDLSNQSLHWISSAAATPPLMPITGKASYTLIGATSPTDNQGNTGVLGSASFLADFTNRSVNSTLVIDIGGVTWNAAGTGNLGLAAGLPSHLFAGIYNAVVVAGATGGSGTFSGFFSDPGATSDPALPGGVGLTYSLQDGQGTTTVSGAAAFGNP